MRPTTALLLCLPLAMPIAGLSACSSGGGSTRGPSAAANDAGTNVRLTRTERSSLRERAIGNLEEFAFDEWAQFRANAMEGLFYAPTRAEGVARAGLADENEGVRLVASMLVGRLEMLDAAPSLRAMLNDPSPLVRIGAIAGLALLGEEVDQTPLARLLQHRRADVRSYAAYAMGEIGNTSALPVLRSAVRGWAGTTPGATGDLFRMQAAEAMVKLGEESAYNALRAGLYPSSPEALEATVLAAQIVGELGDRGSMSPLAEIVRPSTAEQSSPARPSSARGVRTRPASTNAGDFPAELRLTAATAMARLGERRLGFLADGYVASDDPTLRALCAFLYGAIGDDASLSRLAGLMDDQDAGVRLASSAAVVRAMAQR